MKLSVAQVCVKNTRKFVGDRSWVICFCQSIVRFVAVVCIEVGEFIKKASGAFLSSSSHSKEITFSSLVPSLKRIVIFAWYFPVLFAEMSGLRVLRLLKIMSPGPDTFSQVIDSYSFPVLRLRFRFKWFRDANHFITRSFDT